MFHLGGPMIGHCISIYLIEPPRSLWTRVGTLPEQMWCLHSEKHETEASEGMPQRIEVHGKSNRKRKP